MYKVEFHQRQGQKSEVPIVPICSGQLLLIFMQQSNSLPKSLADNPTTGTANPLSAVDQRIHGGFPNGGTTKSCIFVWHFPSTMQLLGIATSYHFPASFRGNWEPKQYPLTRTYHLSESNSSSVDTLALESFAMLTMLTCTKRLLTS